MAAVCRSSQVIGGQQLAQLFPGYAPLGHVAQDHREAVNRRVAIRCAARFGDLCRGDPDFVVELPVSRNHNLTPVTGAFASRAPPLSQTPSRAGGLRHLFADVIGEGAAGKGERPKVMSQDLRGRETGLPLAGLVPTIDAPVPVQRDQGEIMHAGHQRGEHGFVLPVLSLQFDLLCHILQNRHQAIGIDFEQGEGDHARAAAASADKHPVLVADRTARGGKALRHVAQIRSAALKRVKQVLQDRFSRQGQQQLRRLRVDHLHVAIRGRAKQADRAHIYETEQRFIVRRRRRPV